MFRPYGGLYAPLGGTERNEPVALQECNPLPANKMSLNTGDAGQDGYSVLSRANRYSGERPMVGGMQEYVGPHTAPEDY
jgi:hypothetical protein